MSIMMIFMAVIMVQCLVQQQAVQVHAFVGVGTRTRTSTPTTCLSFWHPAPSCTTDTSGTALQVAIAATDDDTSERPIIRRSNPSNNRNSNSSYNMKQRSQRPQQPQATSTSTVSMEQLSKTTSYNCLTVEQLASLTEYFCDTSGIALGELTPAHLHNMHRLQMAWTKYAEQQQQQYYMTKGKSELLANTSNGINNKSSKPQRRGNVGYSPAAAIRASSEGGAGVSVRVNAPATATYIERLLERGLADLACFWSPLLIPSSQLKQRKKRLRFVRTQKLLQLMHTVTITSLIRLSSSSPSSSASSSASGESDGVERATNLLDRMESTFYHLPETAAAAPLQTTETNESSTSTDTDVVIPIIAENTKGMEGEGMTATAFRTFRIVPDNACYLAIIEGWAKRASHGHSLHPNRNRRFALKNYRTKRQRGMEAAQQCARVLQLMIDHAKGASTGTPAAADAGEEALQQFQHGSGGINRSSSTSAIMSNESSVIQNVMPNTRAFNLVLNAWAEQGRGGEAQALLRQMATFSLEVAKPYWATLQEVDDRPVRVPSSIVPAHLQSSSSEDHNKRRHNDNAHAKANAASHSHSLLLCEPDLFSYNTVLKAHAKRGAARQAAALLNEIELLSNSSPSTTNNSIRIRPDKISYTTMIDALANAAATDPLEGGPQPPRQQSNTNDSDNALSPLLKAEQVLERMEERYKATGDVSLKPDTVAYNHVLNAISKTLEHQPQNQQSNNGDRRQQQTPTKQHDDYFDDDFDDEDEEVLQSQLCPAARCERLVEHMEHLYGSGENPDVRPDTYSYNIVINTWANTIDGAGSTGNGGSSTPSAARAEAILKQMEFLSDSRHEDRLKPNTVTYNSVIKAWSRTSGKGNSWAKDPDADAPRRAEALLERMQLRSSQNNGPFCQCRPDTVTYNSVLFAWANSNAPEAAIKIQELFGQMTHSLLGRGSNSIHSKSSDSDSDNIFKQEDKGGDTGGGDSRSGVRPDLTSYNTVLNFWAKTRREDSATHALTLLEGMQRLSTGPQKEYRDLAPDTRSYTAVMNCISKSPKLPHKALRAKRVLTQLEESVASASSGNQSYNNHNGGGPNVYAYSTLLNACAFTDSTADEMEKQEAMDIALEAFSKITKSPNNNQNQNRRGGGGQVQANHVIYGTFLKACSLLMDGVNDGRRRPLVTQVFRRCCREGQVGRTVLEQLYFATDCESCEGLYEELVGEYLEKEGQAQGQGQGQDFVAIHSIPHQWTRNVRENRQHSLKQHQQKQQQKPQQRRRDPQRQ
jgi:hypothetical protein